MALKKLEEVKEVEVNEVETDESNEDENEEDEEELSRNGVLGIIMTIVTGLGIGFLVKTSIDKKNEKVTNEKPKTKKKFGVRNPFYWKEVEVNEKDSNEESETYEEDED